MITYKSAGVDKEEGYLGVNLIKNMAKSTYNEQVLNSLGDFGALYELGKYENPVLVSGTDGVGTKLKIAFELKKYDTIGIDCVAMCMNDILCHGAKPLFFLDYLACGKLDAKIMATIVSGITLGCKEAGASLIGGETAEMPGFYKKGEYDIAGFAVGIVEKAKLIKGENIQEKDHIIGLASSGVHSNGFSLVRKLINDLNYDFYGKAVGEVLLEPTKIYVKPILNILNELPINAMAHITGGGIIENLPRVIPQGLSANIDKSAINILSIFKYIQQFGVAEQEMWGTFNMGIGFILVVNPNVSLEIIEMLKLYNINAYQIGEISKGNEKLCLK